MLIFLTFIASYGVLLVDADCPPPLTLEHAEAVYSSTRVNDTAYYICNEGFVANNKSNTILCQDDDTWGEIQVRCQAVCPFPPSIPHANNDGDGYIYYTDMTANYDCDDTYTRVDSNSTTLTCRGDGTWSPIRFLCIAECYNPPEIPFATISVVEGAEGDTAEYICSPTHIPTGNNTTICTFDHHWTEVDLVCSPNCGNPPYIENTRVELSGSMGEITAQYTCGNENDFIPNMEKNTIRCQDDATWESTNFQCHRICQCPLSIEHASHDGDSTVYKPDQSVTYSCDANYISSGGDTTISCQDDGTWMIPELICLAKCNNPPEIPFATISVNEGAEGDTAEYICSPTHVATGNSTTICTSDHYWTEVDLVCSPNCGDPPDIENTMVDLSGSMGELTAQYICENENDFIPNMEKNTIRCQDDATWESTNFQCHRICQCPLSIEHASHDGDSTVYKPDQSVTYSCDANYISSGGDTTISCQDDGTWMIPELICLAKCNNPPEIPFATISVNEGAEGDTAEYICSPTHVATGNSTTICTSDHYWTEVDLVCSPNCGDPPDIENTMVDLSGSMGELTAQYICENENDFIPNMEKNTIRCQDDATWESTNFQCHTKVQKANAIVLTTLSATTANTVPLAIYFLSIKGICQCPLSIEHASHDGDSTVYKPDQSVTYSCDANYISSGGDTTISCQDDGTWMTPELTCLALCGPPPTIDGAEANTTNGGVEGDEVQYTCKGDFRPVGSDKIQCQSDHTWLETDFSCKADCGTPPNIEDAKYTLSGTLEGDTATYTCTNPFLKTSCKNVIKCLPTKQWEASEFTCDNSLFGTIAYFFWQMTRGLQE